MGLKILECKSLNIEEFDEISSGEQNSVETIKSNSGHGEQEKEKEKENPSDSDNPGQDNLEMCLKNSNSDQGEQEKKIPSDSYNPGQDNLEMCLKNSSSIDDLISEAQKHLPSEKMLSCDESVTMDHFVPFEEELNVDAEYLPNESGIAMDLSSLKNNSEIFSHVQPPAYHFYVCGGTCSFTCLLPGDFKQHLTTCKCINRDLFACFHCRFVGESVEALLRHMHKHAVSHKNIGSKPTNAVFVCSITNCKFSTNILNAFYCHCCQVHPNESSHTCVSCEESFQTAEDLAQHLKVNLLSVVSCKHCMAKDIDKNIVMEHILFEHPGKGKMLNTVKELLCKDRKMYGYYTYQSSLNIMDVAMSQSDGSNMQDSFQASSEQQMEESKKPNRSSSKDSMCCHICNFVASAVSELKQHLTCHEQTPAEDGGLSFICPACPMQVKTLKDFEDHAACHAKNVSFWLYDCPLGDYQTNQVTLMLQHIKKEGHSCESGNMLLGNEKYIISKVITCTCCKFRTTSVAHLNDHMKGHSIITAKDPAVRVAAHSTTDVDATSESVHRTHSHRQNATTTKDRVRHCSKDESKLVKNSTKRRFSSDASKISEAKDSVIFTLPYDSVFQTAVACPQCSFSAFFKTNMLKHIKEKHPMVKVKESSQTVSPVQAKSPKTALSSSNEMCGLEDSNSDKLEGMKLGSSELDTTLATFYKKSGSVLICKICEKQCSKKKILHHHILDHLKLNLWKCTSCDFKDNRRFVIIKHAKNFHSSSDGCVAPVEDFLSRLSEHKCKKGPRKPSFETTVSDGPLCSAEMNEALKCFYKKEDWCLECVVCKMKCSSVILMHKHVLQIHLKHAMFGCNLCWFEGFEEHEVLEHLHAKHPSKPATVLHLSTDISATVKGFIDSCPTSTKSLLLHQNIKKKKLILGNDDMDSFLNCLYEVNRRLKLVCLICKEELSTKYASHRHILAHLGVDLVGCSCCSFQSLSDRDVTEHMKSNHAGIQLKIDYLDVDIAEAVKNFFENSCKTPSKEKKSKGVMHKRQTVERSKATSSTSKVRKPWKGPSSSDAHMGNKKDVTKKIVGGLTKYKCRFCEYLALSVRSVRAHIFRSHPKTEGNLFKCSKCPFQVESLVEITTHMFQKHPWTLEDGFEDCHPSIVSQTNDRVHSTHSGNPFVELEASDSVHSTHSCIEAETSEKDSEEMLLANKPFTEPVSSTKSTLNDGSTDNIQESISMHAENCLKQSYLGFEHITDQVNANEADHSTCKSSGHHHGFLTDTHPRLDKDVDKISDNDEHKNLELCSMDNEVALTLQLKIVSMNKNGSENEHKKTDQCVHGDDELTDLDKRSIMKSRICSGDSDDKKTKERLDKQPRIDNQSMHIDIHERESTDSVKTHNRRKDTIDVGDHSVSNDKTHRNVNHCVYSDITDKDSMASVVTDTKREKSTSADGVVGCKGKKADDLNLYSDIGANKLTNSSTGYTKTKENDSIDSKETSSDKEHNIGNQFSDISDDETTNSIQAYNESKSLVDAVCGSICENTQIDYQGMYSDISDDEITDSTTACSKKRKIDLVDDCASNKTSFNKRHKQKKNPSVIHGDDKKETTLVKRKNMKQKVMIGSPNCGSFTGTKQKAQVQISLDSNITENVQPHKAVLDVGTKKEKLDALFQCSQCSFTTKNEQQSFVRHLKETHNILKYVQCNYCSARYTDTNTVKRHMNFFHKDRCKKYKLLSLSLLFKEVKHEMNKEELVGDLKHVDGISGNKNEKVSSQTCKTKSKKVELIDNTTTSSSLKKHKRISLPKVDKDSSPTYRVDVKEQNSIDKNKSLSSPQNSPVKQKEIKISTALDKDSEALISVQPDEKSSKVILSVKRKDSKTFPMSSPVDHLSESEVDKSTKVLLSFKKKNSPSKQTSGQKGRVLKEKSNKCKSAAASSGGFSSKNKTEDVLEDKTHKVNDENFKYRCKFCNYKDNDTSKMRQHLFVHWHYKPYKCSFCLQGFVSSEKRAIHAKVVHENIVTFCHLKKNKEIEASVNKMLKVFERLAKNDQKMTKIVTKIDQDGLKNEKGLKKEKEHLGNLCTRMSKENSNLANTSRISFKCFYCSKSASSLEGLRIHFGKKHGDIPKKGRFWIDNKTGQICSMSGAVFEDMTNKITYRQSFLCGYCSMRSSKRASVIKHQQFDHSTKMTFIVNLNNAHVSKQRFAKIPDTSDESMAKKIKLVKTLSPNKNEVAESSTKPPASAQSSPTQYCCNHCHHKERSLYHYRRHLASHGTFRYLSPDISQSSALRCGCCNYVASDEKDFSKHVTCHVSGERPYKCGYCSYDAFTRSKVRLHLKSVHSGKEKIIDRQRSRAAAIFSPSAKTLVDIEPVVKVKDIMAVPAAEFGDLLLKHGVTTIDLSYVEDDKMLQILKLFGSGIPEDQLYDLLNE